MTGRQQIAIKEIASELCLYCQKNSEDGTCTVKPPCEASLVTATTILNLTDSEGKRLLAVIAEDQTLPENHITKLIKNSSPNPEFASGYFMAEDAINDYREKVKKAGFVKIEKGEK